MTAIIMEADSRDANSSKEEKRKVSLSERGHVINVLNFEDLEFYCNGFGSTYNPPKLTITLTALAAKRTASVAIIDTLNSLKLKLAITIKESEIAMITLSKLAKRINNTTASSGISSKIKEEISSICQKMQYIVITPLHPHLKKEKLSENELIENYIFSQIRLESRLENFSKLIQLLTVEEKYNPEENDLTLAALTAFLDNMKTESNSAVNAVMLASDAINERNEILYNRETGLIKVAKDVKKYIKKIFGAKSIQYKLVRKLKFKNVADSSTEVY
jgi:hypothetical protein